MSNKTDNVRTLYLLKKSILHAVIESSEKRETVKLLKRYVGDAHTQTYIHTEQTHD